MLVDLAVFLMFFPLFESFDQDQIFYVTIIQNFVIQVLLFRQFVKSGIPDDHMHAVYKAGLKDIGIYQKIFSRKKV